MYDGRREVGQVVVELYAKLEVREAWREMFDWLVEFVAKS
jgi:hypothetical protein